MFNTQYGIGTPNGAPLQDLVKALQAGYTFGVTDQTGGSALRVESLESSLKVLSFGEKHIRMFKMLPKRPAFNTVEEFNVLDQYGNEQNVFMPEGVMPESNDSNYTRKVAMVKYLGVTRSVTHVMTLVKAAHGDVITMENKNGILFLLKKIEEALFWGNNTLCYNYASTSGGNEGIEWSGLDCQIDSSMVYDAQGAPLSEGLLNDAANLIAEQYGVATHLFCPFKVASDFDKTLFSKERVLMPSPTGGLTAGTVIQNFNSHYGEIQITPDIFLKKHRKARGLAPSAASSSNAPQPPQDPTSGNSIAPTVGSTAAGGKWKSAIGNVYYKLTALNRFGESASTAVSTAANLDDVTKKITVTIKNPSSISGLVPDYFNVYRSDTGSTGSFYYIGSIATSSQTSSGTTSFVDDGTYMTNVSTCFLGQMDESVLSLMQLAPLMKMDLAVLGPAIRWMILFYCTFALYAPKKWLKIINVGDLT
jgi:hypothetical protein